MPRGDPRNVIVRLPLTATERERFQQLANKAGLKLAPWLRRCAEQVEANENALELQAADERREQERRRQAAEREYGLQAGPAASRRDRRAIRRGPTVGEALQAADRNAGR
jgi:hypothetical protein